MILMYIPLRFTLARRVCPSASKKPKSSAMTIASHHPSLGSAPDPGRLRRLRANPRLTISRATEIPSDDETLLRT